MTTATGSDAGARLLDALTDPAWAPGETALIGDLVAVLGPAEDGGVDLAGLVGRWVGRRTLRFGCPVTARSIGHLADAGAPPVPGSDGPGLGAAIVMLALVPGLSRQPRNLVSGGYHLAGLLDPHPEGVFGAVAAVVTGAAYLGGRRDFVPDVLDVLIANGAPEGMVRLLRTVPVWEPPPGAGEGVAPSTVALAAVFRLLHHLGVDERVRAGLEPLDPDARRLGSALLAARPAIGAG